MDNEVRGSVDQLGKDENAELKTESLSPGDVSFTMMGLPSRK